MRNYKDIEDFVMDKLRRGLSPDLHYHSPAHTLDVVKAAEQIAKAESISSDDLFLIKVAALYHDTGFLHTYKQHEEESCRLAKADLPGFGLTYPEVETICGMIMATKIPQQPQTLLERILADADLEYLGGDDYDRISRGLFEELKIYAGLHSHKEWQRIQVDFLKGHHYHTEYCLQNREPGKQKQIDAINS